MKVKKLIAITIVTLFNFSNASASLTTINDSTWGVNNIVYDSTTNLQWLSPRMTANQSMNNILTQISGGALIDWRYATSAEATQLFLNAGAAGVYPSLGNSPANAPAAIQLNALFGSTLTHDADWYLVAGWLAPNSATQSSPGNAWVEHFYGSDILGAMDYVNSSYTLDSTYTHMGSWLVRAAPTTVPLPGAAWLFLTGSFGLLGLRRKTLV